MRFDPASLRLAAATADAQDAAVAAVTTLPEAEATDAPLRGPLALRFAESVNLRELAAGKAVKLLGPNGIVDTKVVGAERGRLAFVQLPDDLYPGARYTLFVQGLHTASGQAVLYTAVGFTTTMLRASGVSVAGQGSRPISPGVADTPDVVDAPATVLTTGAGVVVSSLSKLRSLQRKEVTKKKAPCGAPSAACAAPGAWRAGRAFRQGILP
jgi:hypothetical protein